MSMTARAIQPSRASGLPRLQRKCACGHAHAPGHHRCEACEAAAQAQLGAPPMRRPAEAGAAQGVFTISAPDDPYEREADRVAHQVMAETPASVTPRAEPRLQRLPAATPNLTHAPTDVQTVLGTAGRPLDAGTRGFFEPRFGRDFSSVRVHADDAADRSARAVDAQAYTVGHNIVFARGSYAPEADPGRRLLAHELAHVVQQSHTPGQTPAVQRRKRGPGSCGWLDEAAANVLGGEAHYRIQSILSIRGFTYEMPVPRASKKDNFGSRKCQPDGASFGYVDLARITPPAVGISEIKPWWRARSGIARLEAMHYRLRANQSKQRLTKTGPCGMRGAGLDDHGFSTAVGPISAASTFDLLKGAISGIEDFGPFPTDPHRNLMAQETSAGAIGYWCVLNEEGKKKKQEEEDKKKKEKEEKKKKKQEEKERKKKEREEKKKSKQDKADKEKAEREKAKKEKAEKEKAEREKAKKEKAEKEKAEREKAKKEKAEKEKAEKAKGSAGGGNIGFGISIFSSSVGGGNAGIGISVGSQSAAVGTVGASVSWFSDSATAGAAGVSASADSMSATAGAAGASASEDSESITAGAAGASASEGSSSASAGVAGAAESKDTLSASAGAAGKSETEGSAVAGAGGSASGKVSGAVGGSTGSPKKTVDPADVTGPGADKVPQGQSDEEIMAGEAGKESKPGGTAEAKGGDRPAGKPEGTGEGDKGEADAEGKTKEGEGPKGEGDKGGTGERKMDAGPSGPTNTQKQPGTPGGGDPGKAGGQRDPGKASGPGDADKTGAADTAGSADKGTTGGAATTAGAGTGPGTATSSTAGGGAVNLGVLPVFPRQSSNEDREKIGREAAQVSKMLANAQEAQKLLLQYLASNDPTGQYIVPTSVWVDKLLKATDGLKPEDVEYLKTLDWKPGSISAAELRKRVLNALKNKGKPKGDADKPGGKKPGGEPGGEPGGKKGAGEGEGKGEKGGETPAGKQDESKFVGAGGFTSARTFTGDRSTIKERFYRFVVSDAPITAATKNGDKVLMTLTWIGDDGKAYYHRTTYEVVGEPTPQTDPQFKGRKLLRFDLKTSNTDVIDIAPEGQKPFLLTPGRPASFRIFND